MPLNLEKPLLFASAYFLLTLSAIYSIFTLCIYNELITIGCISFGLFFITGLLGFWLYSFLLFHGITYVTSTMYKIFKVSKFITNLYVLPLIIVDLYLKNKYSIELVVAHMLLPILGLVPCGVLENEDETENSFNNEIKDRTIIPFKKFNTMGICPTTFCTNPRATNIVTKQYADSLDFVMFVSSVALSVISCLANNTFGLVAAIVYAMNYFIITDRSSIANFIPTEPIYVVGMGVFSILGMNTLITSTPTGT